MNCFAFSAPASIWPTWPWNETSPTTYSCRKSGTTVPTWGSWTLRAPTSSPTLESCASSSATLNRYSWSVGIGKLNHALFFHLTFLCPKGKGSSFLELTLTLWQMSQIYLQGLSRLLSVPGVLVSFLELRFLGKMDFLALGGRPQPLKNKRDIFTRKWMR